MSLEDVSKESENMMEKLAKVEAALEKYKELCEHSEMELERRNDEYEKKCEEFAVTLEDLNSFNKELKAEKSELQNKVVELKQDLCVYQQGESLQAAAAACALPVVYKTLEEKQDKPPPGNLHFELNQLVQEDETLPSPICGTTFFQFDMSPDVSSPILDPNSPSEVMMREFQQQKQGMQSRIDGLLQQVAGLREAHKGPNGVSSNLIAEQLQDDMTSLLDTMNKLVDAKRSSDKSTSQEKKTCASHHALLPMGLFVQEVRNAKLTDIIKQLRDLVKRLENEVSTKENQLHEEQQRNNELNNNLDLTVATHQRDLQGILDVILSDIRNEEEVEEDYDSRSSSTPSPVEEDDSIIDKQPTRELSAEQVRDSVQKRITDLRRSSWAGTRLAFSEPTFGSAAAESRRLDIDLAAAQRSTNVMTQSYTRPNFLMELGSNDEQNNNENKRERASSLTHNRKTLQQIERRHSDQEHLTSRGERSPPHSRDRSPESEHRNSLTETGASPVKANGCQLSSSGSSSHHDNGRAHVQERTGAEGESDTEDNASPSCKRQSKPRSDSDVDEIDIKADILKNLGPIQSEGGESRSQDSVAKKREELKSKRSVSFKMPQLSKAQEVNGTKEADTNGATSDVDDADENQATTQHEENGRTESPRLVKQDEIDVESPPKLLPNSVLEALGLAASREESLLPCNMTEQEIEDKYNALASALKLDKHTLKRRIELMKHQRDQSELTIERELSAVQQCLKNLELQCENNPTSKECLEKIHKQADILRKMSVWLAGRAEGLGAVQEEGRLSDAADIMVCHVENLRRLYEREHIELEEARRLLQENRAVLRGSVSPGVGMTSFDVDTPDSRLGRRAFSITPGSKSRKISAFELSSPSESIDETSRRRASVAVLGLAGAQLASTSHEGKSRWSLIASKAESAGRLSLAEGRKSISEGVANRTESTDGEESPLPSPTDANSSAQTSPSTTPRTSLKTDDAEQSLSPTRKSASSESAETRTKKEEEIYQQGYEQGVRAKVSEELTELREQQTTFCENLEDLMENAAEEDDDEEGQTNRDTSRHFLPWIWTVFEENHRKNCFHLGVAIVLFLFSLFTLLVLHNFPIHICESGRVTGGPLYVACEMLRPFVKLRYEAPPPV